MKCFNINILYIRLSTATALLRFHNTRMRYTNHWLLLLVLPIASTTTVELIKLISVQLTNLSLLQAVNPSGEGSAKLSSPSQFGSILRDFNREFELLHILLYRVHPSLLLLRCPYTSAFIFRIILLFSSLRATWPYPRDLASRTLSLIHATLTSWRISSLLFLSFRVTPIIHLSIHISVLSHNNSSFLLNDQACTP